MGYSGMVAFLFLFLVFSRSPSILGSLANSALCSWTCVLYERPLAGVTTATIFVTFRCVYDTNISLTLGACRKIARKVAKLIKIPRISTTRSRILAAICQSMWLFSFIISSVCSSSTGSNTYFPCCLWSTWSFKIGVSLTMLCVLERVRCKSDGWPTSLQQPFPSHFVSLMILTFLISQGAEYGFSDSCVKSQFSFTIKLFRLFFFFVLPMGSYFILTNGPRMLNISLFSHLGMTERW